VSHPRLYSLFLVQPDELERSLDETNDVREDVLKPLRGKREPVM